MNKDIAARATLDYIGNGVLETSDGRFRLTREFGVTAWTLTDNDTGKVYTAMRDHRMAEAWIYVILEDEAVETAADS